MIIIYIYPANLMAKATLWLWSLRDLAFVGVGSLLAIFALVKMGWLLPLVVTVTYAFLTIRFDDISILDFLRYAFRYFIGRPQLFKWGCDA